MDRTFEFDGRKVSVSHGKGIFKPQAGLFVIISDTPGEFWRGLLKFGFGGASREKCDVAATLSGLLRRETVICHVDYRDGTIEIVTTGREDPRELNQSLFGALGKICRHGGKSGAPTMRLIPQDLLEQLENRQGTGEIIDKEFGPSASATGVESKGPKPPEQEIK